jgi:hypothetical protein
MGETVDVCLPCVAVVGSLVWLSCVLDICESHVGGRQGKGHKHTDSTNIIEDAEGDATP